MISRALLADWSAGNATALERLIPLVYAEVRRLAHRYMQREDPNRTLQTTALVHEHCEPQRRAALIDELCGADAALRAEVESLLAAHFSDGFTQGQACAEAAQLLQRRAQALPAGSLIGPYRVVREIGEGGMGVVYLAARADESFQKQVAIKVIRRGLDTEAVARRFRNERQILAKLEHPNRDHPREGNVHVPCGTGCRGARNRRLFGLPGPGAAVAGRGAGRLRRIVSARLAASRSRRQPVREAIVEDPRILSLPAPAAALLRPPAPCSRATRPSGPERASAETPAG